jgi:small subunit ribosomal protein S1
MSELEKKLEDETALSSQDYADLVDKYQFKASELAPGKLVQGKVIKITATHVLVDIGSKSEGIIPAEDFSDTQEMKSLKAGDPIEAGTTQHQRGILHPLQTQGQRHKSPGQLGEGLS